LLLQQIEVLSPKIIETFEAMNKFYYLETCDTCRKILQFLNLKNFELREIKSAPIEADELDTLAMKAGSYEAIFSKRARKFRELGLNELSLTENDFRKYLLLDYTFLKRPVMEIENRVLAGNSKSVIDEMKRLA
jgi:arsenate reductase-like glutaredoxin family protein